MIIWPKERFYLREDLFFSERFPVYERHFQAPDAESLTYLAEILVTYVHFFSEREISIHKLYEHFPGFQPADLFK